MNVLSIRRITNDRRHNAFTGACWFKGDLFVGYRQGDDHDCPQGRLIVQRSRDKGITWDTVVVLRGEGDTRDAHLYTDGKRLYAVGHEEVESTGLGVSGFSSSEDGDHWIPWTRYEGVGNYILWRPPFIAADTIAPGIAVRARTACIGSRARTAITGRTSGRSTSRSWRVPTSVAWRSCPTGMPP